MWDLDFKLHIQQDVTVQGRVRGGKLMDLEVTRRRAKRILDSSRKAK